MGGGLNRFDSESKTFTHFTEAHGLSNNVVYGILEDNDGKLWMSTNKGLSCFDVQESVFTNYTVDDGLSDNEFNERACFRRENGEMLFGGVTGLTVFNPGVIAKNTLLPPVYITDFSIPGHDTSFRSELINNSDISLVYEHNSFSVEFAALDFTFPQKNTYQYMLEGFDNDWNFSGERRFADYTNLDPGSYTLRVKATNSDGVWNDQQATLRINIEAPFWDTLWFKLLLATSLVSLLAGIYQVKMYRNKMQQRKLQALVDKRTEKLRESYDKIKKSLNEIKILRGILPICMHCKKIRNDEDYWEEVADYISKNADVDFSHGVCPSCLKEHYPEYYEE